MVYDNTRKKFSGFTKYNTVNLNDRFVGTKDGGNSNAPIQAIIDKVADVYGASLRTYEFESELIADDIQLGEYALVEENGFAFYKITNDAVAGNNIALGSGLTATYESNLDKSATDYDDLRTKLGDGYAKPGNTITLASTTNTSINENWIVLDNSGATYTNDSAITTVTGGTLAAKRFGVYVPEDTYIFNGENLPDIGGLEFSPDAQVNNSIYNGIVQQDAGTAWLHHNHLEESYNSAPFNAITSGDVPEAPLFEGSKQNQINVMAYWYQDFGLEAVRAAGGASGWTGWYYWQWLFHGATGDGYEAERHPWLGYYRGDDPNVLDWQCYWLNEAGVTSIIIQQVNRDDMLGNWGADTSRDWWINKLFNDTKNFNQLKYVLWAGADSGDTSVEANLKFDSVIEVYQQYGNYSYLEKDGGIYPIVFAWEADRWRGIFDSFVGSANTKTFLIAQAAKFQAAGWAGFCVLGRNGYSPFAGSQSIGLNTDHEELEAGGCIWYDAEYAAQVNYNPALNGGVNPAVDYEDLTIGMDTKENGSPAKYRYTVPAVTTGAKSHSAHPSTWNWSGTTPELFEQQCRNVIKRMRENGNPNIFTIYNVSEWAEGGPGLQPNMRDGKGYLTALSNALGGAIVNQEVTRNRYSHQDPQLITGVSSTVMLFESAEVIPMTVGASFTSTATPFITDDGKYNGKRITLTLDNSSPHPGPLILQDVGTLAGSGLRLTAANVSIGRNDSIELEYDSAQDLWIQRSAVVNIV